MGLPYRIGLTGNIATGKTTVGRMLADLGADLIDADQVAHAVMAPGGAAFEPVLQAFGTGILDEDGTIDRRTLGNCVWQNPDALRRLESLVHPAVIDAVERQIADSKTAVVVVEAIKLLESGMAESYDAIWVTTCSEATQIERLMEGRSLSRADALQRIRAQPSQAAKIAAADVVITTEGTLAMTRAQVEAAWTRLPISVDADGEA